MFHILQDLTPNRKTTPNCKTSKYSSPQHNSRLLKTLSCVTAETDYPSTDHPKLFKYNNIQNTRKSTFPSPLHARLAEQQQLPTRPAGTAERSTRTQPAPTTTGKGDVSSPRVTSLKRHNFPTRTCDLTQFPESAAHMPSSSIYMSRPGATRTASTGQRSSVLEGSRQEKPH